ncbi:MAG: hypothetical protein JW801_02630 [Bacteroidales bacterium]|nr:hypothetical protein [Bacteroidales bacterium]
MLFRNRLLIVIVTISVTAITCIYILVSVSLQRTSQKIADNNTINLLYSILLTIEGEYHGLEYHKDYATEIRMEERKNILSLTHTILENYYDDSLVSD